LGGVGLRYKNDSLEISKRMDLDNENSKDEGSIQVRIYGQQN
jgi:hypothetical protein